MDESLVNCWMVTRVIRARLKDWNCLEEWSFDDIGNLWLKNWMWTSGWSDAHIAVSTIYL